MAKAKTPPHKVVMTEGKEELIIANCLEIQVKKTLYSSYVV